MILFSALSAVLILATPFVDYRHRNSFEAHSTFARLDFERREWLDGSAAREVEQALTDASEVRMAVTPTWSRLLADGFGHLGRNVTAGTDGWLFLSDRLAVHNKDTKAGSLDVRLAARMLACLDRRLAQRGCDLDLLIIPRRALATSDHLGHARLEGPGRHGLFLAELENVGVSAPDLVPWIGSGQSDVVWPSMDSHWNQTGCLLAVEGFARGIGQAVPRGRRTTQVVPAGQYPHGGLLREAAGLKRWARDVSENADVLCTVWDVVRDGQAIDPEILKHDVGARHWLVGTSYSNYRTAAFLSHALDRRIRDRAQPALGPVQPLTAALRDLRTGEQIDGLYYELPMHFVVSPVAAERQIHDLPIALGHLLPERRTTLSFFPPGRDEAVDSLHGVTLRKRGQVYSVSPDDLLTSGDGVAFLRFGKSAKAATVVTPFPAVHRRVLIDWPKGRRLDVPLFASEDALAPARLLGAPGRPRVELCVEGELAPERELPPATVASGVVTFRLPQPTELRTTNIVYLVARRGKGRVRGQMTRLSAVDPAGRHHVVYESFMPRDIPRLGVFSARNSAGLEVVSFELEVTGDAEELARLRLGLTDSAARD